MNPMIIHLVNYNVTAISKTVLFIYGIVTNVYNVFVLNSY